MRGHGVPAPRGPEADPALLSGVGVRRRPPGPPPQAPAGREEQREQHGLDEERPLQRARQPRQGAPDLGGAGRRRMPVAATVPVAATASPSTVSASAHQGRKRNGLRRSSSSSLPVSRDGRSRCAIVGCATTTTIATRKATRARRTVGRQAEFACTGARAKTPGSASPVATCTARSRRTGPRPFHIARSSSGVSISTGRAAVSEAGGRTRSSLSHVAPASHQSSPTTASGRSAVTATCRPGRSRSQAASSQPSQEVPQTSPVAGAAHFQPTRSIATVIAVRAKVTVNDSASSRCTDALNRSRRRSRRGVLHQPRRQTVHRSRHPVGSSGSGGRRYGAM